MLHYTCCVWDFCCCSNHVVVSQYYFAPSSMQMWRGASKPWMVAVEDPQQPGRDIGVATREMASITAAWAEAAEVLRPAGGVPALAPGRLALSAVVDVALAVGRGGAAMSKQVKLQRRAGRRCHVYVLLPLRVVSQTPSGPARCSCAKAKGPWCSSTRAGAVCPDPGGSSRGPFARIACMAGGGAGAL